MICPDTAREGVGDLGPPSPLPLQSFQRSVVLQTIFHAISLDSLYYIAFHYENKCLKQRIYLKILLQIDNFLYVYSKYFSNNLNGPALMYFLKLLYLEEN